MEDSSLISSTTAAAATGEEPAQAAPAFDEVLKNKDYQSEFDRRITKALETAKATWVKEEQEKQSEAQKLAKMDDLQKAEHKRQQAEKQLAEREAAVTKRELTATAKEQLISKGFPPELSDVLDYSDAEKCQRSIDTVSAAFTQAVEKAVNERLKGTAPKMGPAANRSAELPQKTLI